MQKVTTARKSLLLLYPGVFHAPTWGDPVRINAHMIYDNSTFERGRFPEDVDTMLPGDLLMLKRADSDQGHTRIFLEPVSDNRGRKGIAVLEGNLRRDFLGRQVPTRVVRLEGPLSRFIKTPSIRWWGPQALQ